MSGTNLKAEEPSTNGATITDTRIAVNSEDSDKNNIKRDQRASKDSSWKQ